MGKYRVKEPVAVLHGNKVTVYGPSNEFVNIDDEQAGEFGERVVAAGEAGPEDTVVVEESQVPANTADTQAAASANSGGKTTRKKSDS
jgi:hypothetical protein